MTVLTLRPDATTANNMVVVGAATAHQALNDDSDASYIGPAGVANRFATCTLTDATVPAGAVVKSVRAAIRQAGTPSASAWAVNIDTIGQGAYLPSTSAITVVSTPQYVWPPDSEVDPVDPDALTVRITALAELGQVYEAYVYVTVVEVPVTNVTAPTGTITNTNTPTVTWANTLDNDGASGGGPQTHYEVKIFSAAQYGAGGFDPATSTPTVTSGITAGGGDPEAVTQWRVTTPLADGVHRVYVRVAQTVNGTLHWSAFDYEPFTMDVDLPGVPTVALAAQNAEGRIRIGLTANAGTVSTDGYELERSTDGGTTWVAVRLPGALLNTDGVLDAALLAGGYVYDYEAPNGTAAFYRARAVHKYVAGYAASAWTASVSATWSASDTWWIKDPFRPALNLALPGAGAGAMFSYPDVNRAARNGVFQPLGALRPVVVADTRGGETGTVVVQLRTTVEQAQLVALLDTLGVLLLQGPSGHGHPDRYVMVADHGSVRVLDKGWHHMTRDTLGWVQVDVPTGSQTGAQYVAAGETEELVIL